MRKLQNTNRTVSNVVVRQDNKLIVCVEVLRALHAKFHSALSSPGSITSSAFTVSEQALGLLRTGQDLGMSWLKPRLSMVGSLITQTTCVIKQSTRQHQPMCYRTAA